MRVFPAFLAIGAVFVSLAGCGRSGPALHTVKGTVTFDGVVVDEGDIIFRPEDTQFRAEGAKIIKGEYTVKARAGKNKISITAAKINPALKSPAGEPVRQDYIPPQYNEATTLREEVASHDSNRFDFKLSSKPTK